MDAAKMEAESAASVKNNYQIVTFDILQGKQDTKS